MNESKPSELAAFYGRVSTSQQDGSKETQLAMGQKFATDNRLFMPDYLLFFDEDESGSLALVDRPQGRSMLGMLKLNPKIKHLIVPKLDRLGRSLIDLEINVKKLREQGVQVHFCNLPLPATGDGIGEALRTLFFQILCAFAEFERNMIVERINDRLANKRSKNELCGTVPYGKMPVPTGRINPKTGREIMQLADHPGEREWIIKMAGWRKAGWSYRQIATQLNALGVSTKIPKGTPVCLGKDPVTKQKIYQPHSGKWQAGNVAGVLECSYTLELLQSPPSSAEQAA